MANYLVVSTFEGGYQPNTALSAATALRNAGFDSTKLLDTYVDGIPDGVFDDADVIAISMPLFDSLQAGLQLTDQIRKANPTAIIVYFGQYATLNAERLVGRYGDYAVVGEWEHPLVNLARYASGSGVALEKAGLVDLEVVANGRVPHPYLARNAISVPDRSLAPSLVKYPQPQVEKLLGSGIHLIGGVEATRGCHHKCTYCSVYAAYDGKVIMVTDDIVVEDVRNLVKQGMEHLTFTDAEFFNAKNHGVRIMRRLHEEFPHLTYDFTTRVDHILEHEDAIREMSGLGLRFITSALEFPTQKVLDIVAKEISVDDIEMAIRRLKAIGVKLNPTFIMYNPWVSKEDILSFKAFIERNDLEDVVDPIQYETRLHLYKGSPLLNRASTAGLKLTEREFHFDWSHPDPAVDEMYYANVTPPEPGVFKRCCLKC
ncbi:arsinothricin biosynthesis radical SAM protein ArsL [Burkholderia oklahomensis]|uniref:arsinothricin biosynthesis radical SAM protein ArsL n=1 Tax=Burkholderia oklahomensis TaxID=342113 RepID=UPI0005721E0D|nr:B12-binding domain-containing radical SAM protein [Burkholderia oklahomensis]AJX30978.1 B12 binding domain protein [Burkholderia oklahomensis C6786]AOI47149.1 radical SAM protein [Burkholderia oklahomensis C6786]KUY47558.1 radical SAM protein [Burkholderia oklahomensis C6786]MBI0360169.1 B12-binding domain-containing radical SAM protein [Burkholderia oklahomensis]SUW59552.1 hopanoid biosynthesis associated radical SAM protein HpnJ [Burkholderia oklahomensis]